MGHPAKPTVPRSRSLRDFAVMAFGHRGAKFAQIREIRGFKKRGEVGGADGGFSISGVSTINKGTAPPFPGEPSLFPDLIRLSYLVTGTSPDPPK